MVEIINISLALLSIALGAISWFWPKYTLGALELKTAGSTMGLSELRASAGALFVGLGIGALILGSASAYLMVGFAWGGAAVGRLTSIILDGPASRKKIVFFGVEAVVALILLVINAF